MRPATLTRVAVLSTVAAIAFAACSSSAATSPSPASVASSAPPPASAAPSSAATASVAPSAAASSAPSAAASPSTACAVNSTRTFRIAWVMVLANTYTQGMYKGAQAGAAGCNVKFTQFDSGFSAQTQYNDVEDIVAQAQKFDGILIQANDSVGIVPAIKAALAAHLQVVALNVPIGPNPNTIEPQVPGLAGSVLTTQVTWGKQLGQMTEMACQGLNPCKVAYIAGVTGSTADDNILQSFKQSIAGQSSIQLVEAQGGGGFLIGPAENVAKNILTAHPDVNVILSSGDQMTHGAELAVDSAGLTGKVKLIGLGASVYGVAAVKAGKWFGTVAILPGDIGSIGVQLLMRHILNPSLPGQGIDPAVQMHLNPLLTQQTIGNFQAQWQG